MPGHDARLASRHENSKKKLARRVTADPFVSSSLGEPTGMPFKSKAQRRKFAELLVKGKIKPETYEEWNRETGGKELPEHVRRKKRKKTKKRKKRS